MILFIENKHTQFSFLLQRNTILFCLSHTDFSSLVHLVCMVCCKITIYDVIICHLPEHIIFIISLHACNCFHDSLGVIHALTSSTSIYTFRNAPQSHRRKKTKRKENMDGFFPTLLCINHLVCTKSEAVEWFIKPCLQKSKLIRREAPEAGAGSMPVSVSIELQTQHG